MRLKTYDKKPQENDSQREPHPDFEKNHQAAKWFYDFWNDKAKVICRTTMPFHNPNTGEKGMVYPDCVFIFSDRLEISFNGNKGIVYVSPVSYNLFHTDFKRQCTALLIKAKVLASIDGNMPSPTRKTVQEMWYNKEAN